MMTDDVWMASWLQHILYAGLGAGILAIAVTVAIEKWGGRIGGILGSIPSTIVPASLGMWYGCHSFDEWNQALAAVPIGMMLNALFLWTWKIFPSKLPQHHSIHVQVLWMSLISLSIWASMAYLWVTLSQGISNLKQWAILATGMTVMISLGITYQPQAAPKGIRKVSHITLVSRGGFAAIAIALAVYISQQGQGTLAGIASVFPAIFLTSMISLWFSQGASVPSGAVAPLMLGSSSVSVYALIVPLCVIQVGLYWGMVCAWFLSVLLISIPSYLWLHMRNRHSAS